jgi:hypothetical protein
MRTITIEVDEQGFTVREDDRYQDGLCWDEMLGMVTELTHPRLGQTKYPMMTAAEWAAWRERRTRHHQQLEQQDPTNHQ